MIESDQSGGQEVVRQTGSWQLEFPGVAEEWFLGDAIAALLDRLPDAPALWATLATRYDLDVFVRPILTRRAAVR